MGQISSNLLKKAFLSTKTTFYNIFAPTCAEIKILRWTGKWPISLDFSFLFICVLLLSFFSFFYLFAAVIDLLLGLLPVERILRKHDYRDRQILPWSSRLYFALSFSLKFRSIFVDISGTTELITLIWASLKTTFPAATWIQMMPNLAKGDHVRHETKGQCLSSPVMASTGVNGLI